MSAKMLCFLLTALSISVLGSCSPNPKSNTPSLKDPREVKLKEDVKNIYQKYGLRDPSERDVTIQMIPIMSNGFTIAIVTEKVGSLRYFSVEGIKKAGALSEELSEILSRDVQQGDKQTNEVSSVDRAMSLMLEISRLSEP